MTRQTRRKFSAEFKTKVVLEALKERHSIEELARTYELHPNQISLWKKDFLSRAASVFSNAPAASAQQDPQTEKLYAQIGELQFENSWLKKKLQ